MNSSKSHFSLVWDFGNIQVNLFIILFLQIPLDFVLHYKLYFDYAFEVSHHFNK